MIILIGEAQYIKRCIQRFECKGFQQMMLMLLLCIRGTPILYYGEELDMEEIILDREQIQDPLGIYFWPLELWRT
ncbi:MAG: hypothetical protein ACJ0DI_12765 [bacterium]